MKNKFAFSKIVIGLLVSTYFIVLALGIYVVIRILIDSPEYSTQALIALFSYVGGVNAISIPFYLTTKRDENLSKYPNIQTIEQYNQMYGNGQNINVPNIDNTINSNDIKG